MFLERMERLAFCAVAESNSLGSELTDDSTPERVVEIDHEDFLRARGRGSNPGEQLLGECDESELAERLFDPMILARVVELQAAGHPRDLLEIDEVSLWWQLSLKRAVQLPN